MCLLKIGGSLRLRFRFSGARALVADLDATRFDRRDDLFISAAGVALEPVPFGTDPEAARLVASRTGIVPTPSQ